MAGEREPRRGKKNHGVVEGSIQEGAGGLLLLAAAHETGLLASLETAIASCSPQEVERGRGSGEIEACKPTSVSSLDEKAHWQESHPRAGRSLLLCSPRCLRQLMLTLLFLNLVGLRRTYDLRGYTGDALGLLVGRPRAYGYFHIERFLSQLAQRDGAEALTTALITWTTQLWEAEVEGTEEIPPPSYYIDGHHKPVYAGCPLPRGLIGRSGKILGCRALVLLHDEQGHPRLATTSRGDQHLTIGLPQVLARYEQGRGQTAPARIIVDREGMAASFLRDLTQAGYTVVTLLRTDQYEGLASFTDVGTFVPLTTNHKGLVTREVAPACFALPLPDQKGQFLPLRVALIRDLRHQAPCPNGCQEPQKEVGMTPWWEDGWQAEPTQAEPTTAKLIPLVTTASTIDAVELALSYIQRWAVQENVIKDWLLPLGLDTNHGFAKTPVLNSEVSKKRTALEKRLTSTRERTVKAKERYQKAALRYTQLWDQAQAKGEERYRALDKPIQELKARGVPPSQWKAERNRRKREVDSEQEKLWQRVDQLLETSKKEFVKWEHYSHQQGDLLRALVDLDANARTMYELDNRKDQIMTISKLVLTNLAMWTRDQCFPPTFAHATWGRLAPFFQLPGVLVSSQHTVSVQLRPFNDRQYNRDLLLLCQRVNERQLHLPDGRLLLFSVKDLPCPILDRQQSRCA